jgi:hypothetical protein
MDNDIDTIKHLREMIIAFEAERVELKATIQMLKEKISERENDKVAVSPMASLLGAVSITHRNNSNAIVTDETRECCEDADARK